MADERKKLQQVVNDRANEFRKEVLSVMGSGIGQAMGIRALSDCIKEQIKEDRALALQLQRQEMK